MIDHLSVGTDDVPQSARFYGPVLGALGHSELLRAEWGVGYGRERVTFLVMKPYDGHAARAGNGVHLAFAARSPADVDAFHATALERGGRCAGAPGPRPALGEKAYCAFVLDPHGNKLEAICGGFSA